MFIKVNGPVIELPLNPDETHPFQVIDDRASISKQFARGIKFRDLTGELISRTINRILFYNREYIYIFNGTAREKIMRIKEEEESLEVSLLLELETVIMIIVEVSMVVFNEVQFQFRVSRKRRVGRKGEFRVYLRKIFF